ncbi:class I SAM-dependent methyltransferase [Candidatus Dojkabacteria bacterium]|uniref:Class I SAM-dependent methyltransferase n=1 Tax=Candidatus Dojkabacteria bacterium TaxID=2099670 RepID=A0A3M0YYN6_9BACT|nr:MAG: class I SAM-dependent methyltransferase [Candidatus Dojkabacteria bacterium]
MQNRNYINKKLVLTPNDSSAEFYDIVNSKIRPFELLNKEINLIEEIIKENGLNGRKIKVLDIGAGTGRHTISLWQKGFDVIAIDNSGKMIEEMLKKIQKYDKDKKLNQNSDHQLLLHDGSNQQCLMYGIRKKNNLRVENKSILEFKTSEKFDAILLFWNTWNEIATNDQLAHKLAKKLKSLLYKNGFILLNCDDPERVDFKNLKFDSEVEDGSIIYRLVWETIDWDEKSKTSVAIEKIFKIQKKDYKKTLISESKITQKWYTKTQIKEIFKKACLSVEDKKIRGMEELYLKIQHNHS